MTVERRFRFCKLDRGGQTVAYSGYRLHIALALGRRIESLADLGDRLGEIGVVDELAAPDLAQDLILGNNLSIRLGQYPQHVECSPRQSGFVSVYEDFSRGQTDLGVSEGNPLRHRVIIKEFQVARTKGFPEYSELFTIYFWTFLSKSTKVGGSGISNSAWPKGASR